MRLCGISSGNSQPTPNRDSPLILILFRRLGSLELFLQQETGVDQDSVLAYLSDGRRLRSENVRELAGAHDQVRVPPN